MFGCAARDLFGWVKHTLAGRPAQAFTHLMMLTYFVGYVVTRLSAPPDRGAAPKMVAG